MVIIHNKWVEKEKTKRPHESAPSQEDDSLDKRSTNAVRPTMKKTLRGVRK